jgi:RNA polymerase sigma-70 factor (ECF subfamily)
MAEPEATTVEMLIARASAGDESALAELYGLHRAKMRRMVRLRLDRRLQGRVDPSDVLQEAYLDLAQRLPTYGGEEKLPFSVWLRLVVGERLLRIHRQHLGTAMRDPGRELSIHQAAWPQASSVLLAEQLMGGLTTASRVAVRAELQEQLRETLDSLEPLDREVIALRHFEELGNDEVATILGLTPSAASKRYVRAMVRLKALWQTGPGVAESRSVE